jgi:hypothetical protein
MTDLDEAVRASLHERALDITSVPSDLLDLDTPAHPTHRRQAWLVAAAVAVVLVAAGAVYAIGHRGKPSDVPPGSCTRQAPTAWQEAFTTERGVQVLASLGDGEFLQLGDGELTTRFRDGTLQNYMPYPSTVAPQLSTDGDDVSLLLHHTGGTGNEDSLLVLGPYAGSYGMRQHFRPDYYQRVGKAFVQDGRVYFTSNYRGGSIRVLELRHVAHWMHTSTLYTGAAFDTLTAHPGVDVTWRGHRIAKQLPTALQAALRGVDPAKVAFSGGGYAWTTPRGIYRYAMPRGTYQYTRDAVAGPYLAGGVGWQPLGTAGRYLVVRHDVGTIQLYDTTSHTLVDTGLTGTVVTSGNMLAVTDANGARVVDTTTLPQLRC